MIAADTLVSGLMAVGIRHGTGVPCSHLPDPSLFPPGVYVPATSEGEAVAIASGMALAESTPVVLIPNPGLSDCINSLASLAIPHELPMVLLVSHRSPTLPQHASLSKATHALLEALPITTYVLPQESTMAISLVKETLLAAREKRRPHAIIVPEGLLTQRRGDRWRRAIAARANGVVGGHHARLDRSAALAAIANSLDATDLLVTTTGWISRDMFANYDRSANFYMAGSMGCVAAIALGIACVESSAKIVAIDGDGALLMRMGIMATIGNAGAANILHVLLDNQCYESTGGQESAARVVDFAAIALATGYRSVHHVESEEHLGVAITHFAPGDGPMFVHVTIAERQQSAPPPRIPLRPRDMTIRFSNMIQCSRILRDADEQNRE